MAISPPERRIWWNEPIEKVELVWIFIALLWGLFMFGFMIAWHFIGQQNLSPEAYRIDPATFQERTEAFAERHTRRVLAALHGRQGAFVERQLLLDPLERHPAIALTVVLPLWYLVTISITPFIR